MIKNNKRGLSAVVTTLMIILLVLIAVGIVWVVVKNIVQSGVEQVDINSKCLGVDIKVNSVTNTSETEYTVILERSAGSGDDEIDGLKLVFGYADGTNKVITEADATSEYQLDVNIGVLETSVIDITIEKLDPESISVAPYFEDASGNEVLCSATNPYMIA